MMDSNVPWHAKLSISSLSQELSRINALYFTVELVASGIDHLGEQVVSRERR